MLSNLVIAVSLNSVLSLIMQSEIAEDFNDLGKLLLGGFAAAVAIAIAFTFIKLRLREKRPQSTQFISISESQNKD